MFHHFHASTAYACSPSPLEVKPLLPSDDANGVGLDAALIASSNATPAAFELWELGPAHEVLVDAGARSALDQTGAQSSFSAAGADAASAAVGPTHLDASSRDGGALFDGGKRSLREPIAVELQCSSSGRGALCVARPNQRLKPRTRYEWAAVLTPPGGGEPSFTGVSWRSFTTSDSRVTNEAPSSIEAEVTDNEFVDTPDSCGTEQRTTLTFAAPDLEAPVVINLANLTPNQATHAQVLTPSNREVVFHLYNPPACLTPEFYDETGARRRLPAECLPVRTTSRGTDLVSTGCSVTPRGVAQPLPQPRFVGWGAPSSNTWLWTLSFVLAFGVSGVRRRRQRS